MVIVIINPYHIINLLIFIILSEFEIIQCEYQVTFITTIWVLKTISLEIFIESFAALKSQQSMNGSILL